jgi:hypothetical protein
VIQPTASFKDNLALLPSVASIARIDLADPAGAIVARIENQPGKQGSLAVYQYIAQNFSLLDTTAATHALDVFAEHTADAKARPGAHPNIDRLLEIVAGASTLSIKVIEG